MRFLYAERVNDNEVNIYIEIDGNEHVLKTSYFVLLNDLGINLLTHKIIEK